MAEHPLATVLHKIVDKLAWHSESDVTEAHATIAAHFPEVADESTPEAEATAPAEPTA